MTFWGVEIKPGKPYSHRLDEVRGRLHVSQATLGFGSSTKRSLVQCNVGNKSPVLLCSLLPDKTECSPLDLEFEEEDEVVFSVIGPRSVHLTGFYVGNYRDVGRRDDDTYPLISRDSYGEDIAETETEESTDYDTEDEYEDDFIDDGDIEMFPPSPIPNSGVVIEELLDDEKPPNGHGNHKRLRRKYQPSDSDGDDNSQKQIVVKDTSVPELESEDEDGFPISFPNKPSETRTEAEAEEKSDKKTSKEGKKKKKGKDDSDGLTGFKRKVDTAVQDFEPESASRGSDQLENSSMPSAGIGLENGERPKKKKKNRDKEGKAVKAGINDMANIPKEEKTTEEEKNDNADQNIATKNEQDQKLTNDKSVDIDAEPVDENHSEEKKKRKKKKKKNKNQEVEAADANLEGSNLATEQNNGSTLEIDIQKGKPSQVRTFANGLVIEELSMGKPDGKRASPGNKVSVGYIGKLKKNGQIFDSNIGRAPFKFRLGVGEVVKGWDVGVNGMRIGDKRRLTIPPSMGYGSKGAGGKIPPNAWLVFDVELVDVR